MFDGLKDKLGDFRRDVEEEVEGTEADDESEAAAETETGDDQPSRTHSTTTEPASDDEATEPGRPEDDEQRRATPDAPNEVGDTTARPETENDRASARDGIHDTEPAGGDADAEIPPSDTEPDSTEPDSAETEPVESEPTEKQNAGMATRARLFATGKTLIEAHELEGPLDELELALLASDVEMGVAGQILSTLREELVGAERAQVKGTGTVVEEALAEALLQVISVGQFDFEARIAEAAEKPVTIVFTGVNGVGKTTTIAKLARYFERRGLSTVLANGDTYRAGANQQISEHADALDKRLITHEQGSDSAAVLYDAVEYAEANDIDVVLGDTAGRLHTSNDLMAQLEKIDRVVEPDMTLFVDEAVAGQDATERAREFDAAAAIDGAILTKADADSQGGAAISIAHVTGKPILFLGTGQGYDDIRRFEPEQLVAELLEEGDAGGEPDTAEA